MSKSGAVMWDHESTNSRNSSGKIQIECVACNMGRKLAHRPHSESDDQQFSLRLAACHTWSPPGIHTGPHTVQHLHKRLGR